MRRLLAWFRRLIKGDQEFVIMSGDEVLGKNPHKPNPWDEYRPRSPRNVLQLPPDHTDCAPNDNRK